MTKRIRMLSQVKRKRNLLLALTLTVLFTGSILAFSIQEAYSAKNYDSAKSNTTSILVLVQDVLNKMKADPIISGDANLTSSIEHMVMQLDEAKKGLVEMDKFYSALDTEFQSLKQKADLVEAMPSAEPTRQTTESATEKGAYSNITLERIDFANGFVVLDDLQNVAPKLHQSVCTAQGSCETLFNDSWVIVVSKSMLGDTTSDKLEEYLKVTLSDTRIATIVENERTGISGLGQDDLLTKAAVAPELQPKDIKSKVPPWVRNNAGWYAEGLITEVEFVKGLEWMINNGVIEIQNLEDVVKK